MRSLRIFSERVHIIKVVGQKMHEGACVAPNDNEVSQSVISFSNPEEHPYVKPAVISLRMRITICFALDLVAYLLARGESRDK